MARRDDAAKRRRRVASNVTQNPNFSTCAPAQSHVLGIRDVRVPGHPARSTNRHLETDVFGSVPTETPAARRSIHPSSSIFVASLLIYIFIRKNVEVAADFTAEEIFPDAHALPVGNICNARSFVTLLSLQIRAFRTERHVFFVCVGNETALYFAARSTQKPNENACCLHRICIVPHSHQ